MATLFKTNTEEQIKNLQQHIDSRKASLPYIDRGYFNEKQAIKKLEEKLKKLKKDNNA